MSRRNRRRVPYTRASKVTITNAESGEVTTQKAYDPREYRNIVAKGQSRQYAQARARKRRQFGD